MSDAIVESIVENEVPVLQEALEIQEEQKEEIKEPITKEGEEQP